MVIWPAFRMEKYRVNDHPYHASQFSLIQPLLVNMNFITILSWAWKWLYLSSKDSRYFTRIGWNESDTRSGCSWSISNCWQEVNSFLYCHKGYVIREGVSFLLRICLSRRCLMCSEQLFIPDFEQSNFQMFLWHHISILLFIPDFNKVKVAFYSVFDQHTEQIHSESKSGIKSNFDFI